MIQIVTGIVLAMHYAAERRIAFKSVEHIMRDVNSGWLLRYAHANGASMFFIVVYIHILRGLYYGSYKAPREMVWLLGVVIFLLMMATAFMGYVLPWGQMSFWGAQVITGFFSAIPVVGEPIRTWLLGGFAPDNAALNRFFSLHYLLPFVIAGVVILHIWALHIPGSNNPTGVDVKGPQDTVPFHPYYTAKDGFGLGVFLILFALLRVLRAEHARPSGQLHPGQPALDAGAHRARMVFPAVLRDPAGVHLQLPVDPGQAVGRDGDVRLDPAAVLPAVARYLAGALGQLPADVPQVLLGAGGRRGACSAICGQAEPNTWVVLGSQICAAYYFAHFLIILPIVSRIERPLPLPNSITESVLHGDEAADGSAPSASRPPEPGERQTMLRFFAPLIALSSASASSPRCCSRSSSRRARRSRKPPRTSSIVSPRSCSSPATARSASSTGSSCSAASRCTRKSARPATRLHLVAFRDLQEIGFTEPEVKAIAKQWATEVPSVNPETAKPATRKAIPADHFPAPIPTRRRRAPPTTMRCRPICR